MPISGQCPGCKATLKLSDSFCGKKVRCVKCGKDFMIQGPGKTAEKKTNPSINLGSKSGKIPKGPDSGIRKAADSGTVPSDFEADKGSGGGAILVIGGLAVLLLCVLLPGVGGLMYFMSGDKDTTVASAKTTPEPDNATTTTPEDKTPTKVEEPKKETPKKDPKTDKDGKKDPPKTDPAKDKDKDKAAKDNKDKAVKDKGIKAPPPPKKEDPPKKDGKTEPAKKDPPPKEDPTKTKPAPPEPEPKTPDLPVVRQKYTDEVVGQLLDDLRGEDPDKKLDAADRLGNGEPLPKRRAEAARALEALLDPKGNEVIRRSAVRALGVWGDAKTVPLLLERLGEEEKDVFVKALAIEALGQLKDGKAAEAVANCLADLLLRYYAAKSLRAMGSPAEKAVLKMVEHKDAATRAEACKVLADIGTKASVPVLQNAAKDPNPGIANAANQALQILAKKS
jgi:hypothetical protein